jgi:hypothetical protein
MAGCAAYPTSQSEEKIISDQHFFPSLFFLSTFSTISWLIKNQMETQEILSAAIFQIGKWKMLTFVEPDAY